MLSPVPRIRAQQRRSLYIKRTHCFCAPSQNSVLVGAKMSAQPMRSSSLVGPVLWQTVRRTSKLTEFRQKCTLMTCASVCQQRHPKGFPNHCSRAILFKSHTNTKTSSSSKQHLRSGTASRVHRIGLAQFPLRDRLRPKPDRQQRRNFHLNVRSKGADSADVLITIRNRICAIHVGGGRTAQLLPAFSGFVSQRLYLPETE